MMTRTLILMPTLDCLHRLIFLLHVYRSVSLACMRRYMQLAYLFHQCAKSLLSRDGRIADCTVRHPGVERPFYSIYHVAILLTMNIIAVVRICSYVCHETDSLQHDLISLCRLPNSALYFYERKSAYFFQ